MLICNCFFVKQEKAKYLACVRAYKVKRGAVNKAVYLICYLYTG